MKERAKGRIVFVRGAMLVVEHDDGFALVELLGDEGAVSVGDIVYGDFAAQGGEPLSTETGRIDAFFQGSWETADIPIQMARRA